MNDSFKKSGLDVRQARRMVHDRSLWRGFIRGNAWGVAREMKPLTLMRCHSCELPQLYKAFEGRKSVCGQVQNLRT